MEAGNSNVATQGATLTSLSDFVTEHGAGLTRFAYLLCGDRGLADDLVQDTYVALYRRFGAELSIAAPVAYARQTIVHTNISRSRRRRIRETPTDALPDVAVDGGFPDDQDAMWRTLTVLPDRQRTVLVLRYYADLADHDIARTLGCAEGTVRSLAARAFATLRAHPDVNAPSGETR